MISSTRPRGPARSTRSFVDGSTNGDVQDTDDEKPSSNGEVHVENGTTISPATSKLKNIKNKVKDKASNILHGRADGKSDGDDDLEDPIQGDPAFHPGLLLKKQEQEAAGASTPIGSMIKTVGSSIAHPRKAIKSKATRTTAGKLSKPNRPFLSQDADADFLQAHEDLEVAMSSRSSQDGSSDTDSHGSVFNHHRNRIEHLKAERTSLKIAWTTSRHVTRARVTPKRQWPYPKYDDYVTTDEQGKRQYSGLLPWLGQFMVWYTQDFAGQYVEPSNAIPFNVDVLRHHVERIAIVSAPWQTWFMDVRSVYRWENPHTTGKWLALFLVLWYYNHVLNFLYAYILYAVLRNRYYPTSVESLRAARYRVQDKRQRALQISELMDRHGNDEWLKPLAKDLGPFVQLQVNDLANFLEILQNFYHWTAPQKTAATLFFFFACLLMSLLADMAFCMKVFWFISGGTFFTCWPIASLYPRYRLLVSPLRWSFWGIPTDAEWSFMYLRREAQEKRAGKIKRKVERRFTEKDGSLKPQTYSGRFTSIPLITGEDENHESLIMDKSDASSDSDSYHSADSSASACDGEAFLTFTCTHKGLPGRLYILSSSISFSPRLKQGKAWERSYLALVEMRKRQGLATKQLPISRSMESLELTFTDGESATLKAMKGRDDAFNAIIAFSGIQWQNLQPDM